MPRYQAPSGTTGINIGGQQFNADSSGVITLPDEGSYTLPEGYTRLADAAPAYARPATRSADE